MNVQTGRQTLLNKSKVFLPSSLAQMNGKVYKTLYCLDSSFRPPSGHCRQVKWSEKLVTGHVRVGGRFTGVVLMRKQLMQWKFWLLLAGGHWHEGLKRDYCIIHNKHMFTRSHANSFRQSIPCTSEN